MSTEWSIRLAAKRSWVGIVAGLVGGMAGAVAAADATPAFRVVVPLPIRENVDETVAAEIERRLSELGESAQRPVVVLEFRAARQRDPRQSRFEDALSLARFLTSPRMRRVKTVAYLPQTVLGHAVLAVAACEQIVMHAEAELGAAGIAEEAIDPTVRRAYADIAERRRTLPVPILLAMLDPRAEALEIELANGARQVVLADKAKSFRASGKVVEERTLGVPGKPLVLTAEAMRNEFGYASHTVGSLRELAAVLRLDPGQLADDPRAGRQWQAVRVHVEGELRSGAASRIRGRIVSARRSLPRLDLLLVVIDSPGGDPEESLRLAFYLAQLRSVRTIAVVPQQARGTAVLVALACDELYVGPDAILGGVGTTKLSERVLDDLADSVKRLAKDRGIDWSLPLALVHPDIEVGRYRQRNGVIERYLCEEELAEQHDPGEWKKEGVVRVAAEGMRGPNAVSLGIAREVVAGPGVIESRYGIAGRVREAKERWLVESLQRLAAQPWFTGTLLFIAFFALMSELSAPGLGVAGFISGLAFLLFFWASFLNQTAGWLELLLFAGGLVCLALEIFVLPGFGIFGIGGIIMVMGSLVLASQTFIIPANRYQVRELSRSLWLVAASMGGVPGGIWFIAKYLHRTPVLNQMALGPLSEEERRRRQERELPVTYDHLLGTIGQTTTPLVPAGKARFGDDVLSVISEGELIEAGQEVEVIDVVGRKIVVARRAQPDSAP